MAFPFVGDRIGGSHLSALLLIEGLLEAGRQPVVIVHQEGPLTAELQRRSIPWVQAPAINPFVLPAVTTRRRRVPSGPRYQMAATFLSLVALRRLLRKLKIRVVHTNDARIHRAWGFAAHAAGIPQVWHQRSPELSPRMARMAKRSGAMLTVSDYARRLLPPELAERTIALDNPFQDSSSRGERAQHRAHFAAELGVGADHHIVGFVSSFIDRKRPGVFIEMAARLTSTLSTPAVFPMIGVDDPATYATFDREIQRRGLQGVVRLLPFRTPIDPAMAALDVLVAPSVAEPFARTLVEAMFAGTPVVAAADGGSLEMINHARNGLLVDPDNADAFAKAVGSLLTDPALARGIAADAYTTVADRFSVDRHVEQVVQVYEKLAPA